MLACPALAPEHAVLATWLLAGLRTFKNSYELSDFAWYSGAAAGQFRRAGPRARTPSLSPAIRGWTLGMVAGTLAPSLPMVLACDPEDQHIAEAYNGFVEQLLHLASAAEPWPELAGTALYVRSGGLAEALRPAPEPRPR